MAHLSLTAIIDFHSREIPLDFPNIQLKIKIIQYIYIKIRHTAFSRHLTTARQLYLVIIVSDFSLLEFFSEQDQGPTLIAGKPTPSEVFGAQRRWLQACRGLLVLTRVSSKAFEAVTEEKPWRLDAVKLWGTSVFQHSPFKRTTEGSD